MKPKAAADFRRDTQISREPTRIHANQRSDFGGNSMKYARSFLQVLLATLREIFDENAYGRFLQRTGQASSIGSYREFQREREVGIATRPRCC